MRNFLIWLAAALFLTFAQAATPSPGQQGGRRLTADVFDARGVGPNGLPMIYNLQFNSQRAAQKAASSAKGANGAVLHEPHMSGGYSHFHSTKDGVIIKDGKHHNFGNPSG
ncbi:hypothetical protein BV898_17074 [Hypsibius exemplaris]|uniref:Uncharacterized protein n=1 Tax=Hypsibius exemplaris TaxID=2072580 RepID=A0A9X6RMG9_HYPEX|nr:hypothetical protein BV898_17074 [Hypsibius exemplaris]